MSAEYFTARIDVGIASDAQFNVIATLEGTHNRNLHYIEEQSHCRLTVQGGLRYGPDSEDDGPLHILIMGDTEEDLERGRTLCENLIATVRLQRQRTLQAQSAKKAKKKKNAAKGVVTLPDQLIAAMRVYFPGDEAELAPPGSSQDFKQHRQNFRMVGKQYDWFSV
jgi:hypothetical protein